MGNGQLDETWLRNYAKQKHSDSHLAGLGMLGADNEKMNILQS